MTLTTVHPASVVIGVDPYIQETFLTRTPLVMTSKCASVFTGSWKHPDASTKLKLRKPRAKIHRIKVLIFFMTNLFNIKIS